MHGGWRPWRHRGTRATGRHGGSRDRGTRPHRRRSHVGLCRHGRSCHGRCGGLHHRRRGGLHHGRLSPHGWEPGAARRLWTSTGPRLRNSRWVRTHRCSRGCRYAGRHRRDGRPCRPSRHLHGRRCWRGRVALCGGRRRRKRDGRHLNGRRPPGRTGRGHRRRGHGSNGRGSWRRSHGRLSHGLRRPRHRTGNSPRHRACGRRLRCPRGRCHRHLGPRGIRRNLLCMRARHRHLLCARYRRLSHARLHARRARCHGCTGWHGSMLRSGLRWRVPRLNRCMVCSRCRVRSARRAS
jgi:hypothetical protein